MYPKMTSSKGSERREIQMTILNVRSCYEFNQKEETEAFREVSVFYKTVKEEQLAWPAMATG